MPVIAHHSPIALDLDMRFDPSPFDISLIAIAKSNIFFYREKQFQGHVNHSAGSCRRRLSFRTQIQMETSYKHIALDSLRIVQMNLIDITCMIATFRSNDHCTVVGDYSSNIGNQYMSSSEFVFITYEGKEHLSLKCEIFYFNG